MSMLGRALSAEVRKITTTRLWWVLALIMVSYVALTAGGIGALFGAVASGSLSPEAGAGGPGAVTGIPDAAGMAPLVYSFAGTVGYVFSVLFGALIVTAEYRHGSIGPTFLQVPRRGIVFGAKLAVGALFGAAGGVLSLAGAMIPGAAVLAAFGLDPELGAGATWALAGRVVLAMAAWGALGAALGALLRSQVAAIIIILAFTQFVEPLLRVAAMFSEPASAIARYLPGSVSDSLIGASFYSTMGTSAGLEWWQGGLVLAAYALLAALLALVPWRRDVT